MKAQFDCDGPFLHKNILKLLRGAPISEEVCKEVGITSNDPSITGINADGIAYPYRSSEGDIVSYRVGLAKPFPNEKGKLVKYLQKEGAESYPFYVPSDRQRIFESTDMLVVTEGEKKLLALKTLQEFKHIPVVSFPGAHNWQIKESGGKLSHPWLKISFKGRRVLLIADTDFFSNFQVYLGYIRFIKQLIEMGTSVHLIDLRPDERSLSEDKIGVDDAIEKYGVQYVLDKVSHPCWKFEPVTVLPKTQAEYANLIASLVIYSKAEQSMIFDQLKITDTRFNKSTGKLILKEAIIQWSSLRPQEKEDESVVVWNNHDESLKVLFQKIGQKLSKIPNLFRFSGLTTFVQVAERKPKILSSTATLGAFLANHVSYRKAKQTPEGPELLGIEHIPENHLLGLIESQDNVVDVPEVNFVTATPQVTNSKIISEPGYDPESKIFYVGEPLVLNNEAIHLDRFLDSFPFETELDRLNCLGLLISLFYVQSYVGQHPAIIIQGDEQSLGKTELARCLAILFQAKEAQVLTWTHDEELKKTASGSLSENDFIIIDNVKAGRDTTVISSQAMEGLITAPMLTFRALGENRVFSRPNNAIFSFTLNKGVFSDDLVVRSVAISMSKVKRGVMREDFKPVEYVTKYRGQIMGEVAAMIRKSFESSVPANLPGEGELGQFKFKTWAIEIQKVLMANGKSGFLTNQAYLAKKMSPIHNALENFIVQQLVGMKRPETEQYSASDILRCLPQSVFNGDQNFASQVSLIGRALKNIKTVAFDGEIIDVKRHASGAGGKSYRYSFSLRTTGASELF